jgi:hypothetical protein
MIKLPELLDQSRRYFARWHRVYTQWEFWAITIVTVGIYTALETTGVLAPLLGDATWLGRAIVVLVIMFTLPYAVRNKTQALRKGSRGNVRRFLPMAITGLLAATIVAFCFPIFTDPGSSQPLSGITLMLQQPLAIVVPVLYGLALFTVVRDYKQSRISAMFWIIGGYFSMLAVALAYTNTDADAPGAATWALAITMIAPLLAIVLCLIPQKASK